MNQKPVTRNQKPPLAVYCDVDGTLAATTIVTPLIWLKRHTQAPPLHALWLASLCVRGPWWFVLDRFDRGASNRAIYSCYCGMDAAQLRALQEECYVACVRPRLYPKGLDYLNALRAQGVKIVLVTGGLDFVMQPLARELGADLIAPGLCEQAGLCTGALTRPALTGEHKAEAVKAHAKALGIELAESFALGDAFGDLKMLECVGHPLAINPDSRLKGAARERGWKIEWWTR